MKRLTIMGDGGFLLSQILLDISGENFVIQLPLPIFLPVIAITMVDIDKKDERKLRKAIERVRSLTGGN